MKLLEITDFDDPRLDVYSRLNEAQLLHYDEPAPGIFLAESALVVRRALALRRTPRICPGAAGTFLSIRPAWKC